MVKITKEAALSYHETGRPGKIEVKPVVKVCISQRCLLEIDTFKEVFDKTELLKGWISFVD